MTVPQLVKARMVTNIHLQVLPAPVRCKQVSRSSIELLKPSPLQHHTITSIVSNSNNYPTNWSPSEYDAEYTRKEAHRTVTAPRSIRGTHYGLTDEHNSQMQAGL